MRPLVEVRRLLHVNYNCVELDRIERWYGELFAMKTVMTSDSEDTDGTPFGLQMPTSQRTAFLYDHRGARRTSSLEIVQWRLPPTIGRPYPNPWDHGIQALAFSAPDLAHVARRAVELGGRAERAATDHLLLRDPEGLRVEVYPSTNEHAEQLHLRVVVHDLAESMRWWQRIGFVRDETAPPVPVGALWPGDDEHAPGQEAAMVATDDPSFRVRLTTWSGPPPVGPTYGAPFHQGLYRMAMAVDDVRAAWRSLVPAGLAIQPPYTFPLPGTRITDGLTILFLRDPDGLLVELVERPRHHFR